MGRGAVVNPCSHFTHHSSTTGLDSEGVCLTCKTEWSLEDVRRAVKRANSVITVDCALCGKTNRLSGDDVYVLTGDGQVLVYDCTRCGSEMYDNLAPEAAAVLKARCVMFTPVRPITPREVKAYEITLYAVDDLARLAGMAS
jgi:DNA-directed RNA polymerase subunit RPC12/RpoP